MSTWDDQFKQHPVHQELADATTEVRKLKLPRKAVEAAEARQRLVRALDHVAGVLGTADSELTLPAVLDASHQQIAPLRTQINYADGEEDPTTYLSAANAHADSMLQSSAGITPRLVVPEDIARLQESATNFRQSAGQLVRHVREEAEEVASEIETLRSGIPEVTAEIEGQKGRLDQAIAEHQEQFSTEQTEREERFRSAQDDREKNAQEALENLGRMEENAKRHLDVIGVVGMSGGYQQEADKEESAANIWRRVAVGSVVLAIALNIALIVSIAAGWPEEDFQWDRQVPRVLVTISLLALASYAGVESSRHRRRQEVNRQIEKELASLDPYLALFDDDEKKQIKKEKFDLFFKGRTGHGDADMGEGAESG